MGKSFGIGTAAALAMTLLASTAQAAVQVFDLSVVDPAAGLSAGPYGTVTVTENAGKLDFNVALNSGFKIHDGNSNHQAFAFDLIGDPAITISNLTSGFGIGPAPTSSPPLGNFDYSLSCTGCGPGYAGGNAGPLNFEVASAGALTLASLGFNTVSGQHIYFTSDIVGANGATGNVGAILTAGVPEPATWALMILGFGMLGSGLRLRRRESVLAA